MQYRLSVMQTLKWFLITSLLSVGLSMAHAQTEPTLKQVYATAQAGKLDQAQLMIQQVLISHPNSAKAFFVRSELYARQADLPHAREALASAEKLAPGLPFAAPDAVQKLRAQLASPKPPSTGSGLTTHSAVPMAVTAATSPVPTPSSISWVLPLLLAAGVIALGYFLFRKKQPSPQTQQPAFVNPNGLTGPQNFGQSVGGTPYGQPAYPNQSGMQPPYGQPAGSGLGGRIMGGVATGLAVGAGVMAAEAIGRSLMGNHTPPAPALDNVANHDLQSIDSNPDMGGQNFGINDSNSWDDAGSMDVGGGGDWDN